jgi:malate permease and related proteins
LINFIIIALCIISGMLFRRSGTLPGDAHKGINAWLIYIALPAVSLKYLPNIAWSSELLLPAIAPVIVWLGAWVYIKAYAVITGVPKVTEGALKLSCGLSNTSFIGFPLVLAYFGEKALAIAIIFDQVNFALLCLAGVIVAINSSGKHVLSANVVAKKLVTFPPFIACITALTLPRFIDISALEPLFEKLAATVGPLALFSVGLQLKFSGWREELRNLEIGLLYKLILAPALVFAVVVTLKLKGTIAQISVFEAAMPTLVTSGIVADEYGVHPKLSNLMIGISIVAAFATTALWVVVLKHI